MVDSVAVFDPGTRIEDASGTPVPGAVLLFFDANTTNPKTVYADALLSIALGTSVICDPTGRPTSNGTTLTDIFVGIAPYKIVIEDSGGVTLETKDNRPGAVVSASSVDVSVTATFPVAIKSLDYTVLQADQNTTFVGNCSSADVNFTLPSAVPGTVAQTGQVSGAGWKIKIQHGGSANHVVIKTVSSQTLSGGVASSATQLVLVRQGEEVELTSDGGNWRVSGHTQGAPHSYTTGIIQIVSRLATSPGSPTVGDKYILTGTGGSWAFFSVGDIATWVGSTWVNQTPPSNCGWVAYVQAESLYYTYQSTAWVAGATQSAVGMLRTATQSDQETGTSTSIAVAPGTQRFHPLHPKAWGYISGSSGSILASSGVTSITRNSTGNYTIALAVAMSSANYAVIVSAITNKLASPGSLATGGFGITTTLGGSSSDADFFFVVFGDQ